MPAVLIITECRGMFDTHRINIEGFCSDRGFLFHRNGSGAWGNDRYWTYYKVENNDRTVFSIEYFPVRNYLKICHGNSCYQGTPESLEHMLELLSAMRIDIEELALDKDIQDIPRIVVNPCWYPGEELPAQLQRSSTVIILHVMQLRFEKFRVGTTDFSERGGGLED